MASVSAETSHPASKPATKFSIALAFASVYFFWGSTYTAIRIGAAEMPALLLAGTRFLIAGSILLAWCRWRGLRMVFPSRDHVDAGAAWDCCCSAAATWAWFMQKNRCRVVSVH